MQVGPGVAFKGESLFEVEGEHTVAGLSRHQVAERTDRDRLGPIGDICRLTAALEPFDDRILGGIGQDIEELVRLDADALAARHLDVGLAHGLVIEPEGDLGAAFDLAHRPGG